MAFSVRHASEQDIPTAAAMACCIWHSSTPKELETQFLEITDSREQALFLALDGETACGFAQCGLRHGYVEGTSGSPVGYLEGIYVAPEYRRKGCSGALLSACENWARTLGCEEFASDCELDNIQSLHFHLKAGFREANRIICFAKKL